MVIQATFLRQPSEETARRCPERPKSSGAGSRDVRSQPCSSAPVKRGSVEVATLIECSSQVAAADCFRSSGRADGRTLAMRSSANAWPCVPMTWGARGRETSTDRLIAKAEMRGEGRAGWADDRPLRGVQRASPEPKAAKPIADREDAAAIPASTTWRDSSRGALRRGQRALKDLIIDKGTCFRAMPQRDAQDARGTAHT